MIADGAQDTAALSHGERTNLDFRIACDEVQSANWHMHLLLYGLINNLLETTLGKPLHELEQLRIPVQDAPDPDHVGLPTFIDIAYPNSGAESA